MHAQRQQILVLDSEDRRTAHIHENDKRMHESKILRLRKHLEIDKHMILKTPCFERKRR